MSATDRAKGWVCVLLTALALLAGQNARAQTTLFSEDFEGVFPGTAWRVGDFNPAGVNAFWDDVDSGFGGEAAHGGAWMGYCAGLDYQGTVLNPLYETDMWGFMERDVNLAGATSPTITFWYNIPSIDEDFDFLELWVDNDLVWSTSSATFGWQQITRDLSAYIGGTHTIGFWFYSDDFFEFEGAYLDDIVLSVGGTPQPNLTPYHPVGWSGAIVLSKTTGTSSDDIGFLPTDTVYLDWAVINGGAAAISTPFTVQLLVDDVVRQTWNASSLGVGTHLRIQDYSLGSLTAGAHTIKIRADPDNVVTENNEADNEHTKIINVGGSPEIRIEPLSLDFAVTNSGDGFTAAAAEEFAAETPEQKLTAANAVLEQLDAGADPVHVIVNLVPPVGKPRQHEWDSRPKLRNWQRAIKDRQDEVLAEVAPDEFRPRHIFENQSGFSGFVSRKGLAKLARHPRVESIQLSRIVKPHLAQGIPLMNGSLYRSTYNGSGVSVAIVDSGVDYNHPRLGGGGFPNTKVIGGHDFGDSDTNPLPNGNSHGTACAGIAAGALGTVGDYIGGVAPNSKIYALKITPGGSQSASDADIIAAWNWCITHKNDDPNNPILVISTSFGGDRHFNTCDSAQPAYAVAAANAAAAGITVLVSSGNEGYCDSMGSPACVSSVISVGAVYDAAYGTTTFCIDAQTCVPKTLNGSCGSGWATDDVTAADKVTRYSNTAPFLGVLAPAHQAYTTDIVGAGGYAAGDYTLNFGGTSAACPYAAGAVAALQSAAWATSGRFLTPAEVSALLSSTGDPVSDPKAAQIIKPRVNLGKAIEALGQSASFTIFNDGTAPLNVTSIAADSAAPWISWLPSPPFTVGPGNAQVVGVSVDAALAPAGPSTRRLLVNSNDGDESPYPGGVFINVNSTDLRPPLTAILGINNRVVIRWPTNNATDYTLQWVHALPATLWSNVPAIPVLVGTNRYVTNSIVPGGKKFYRLRKP